MLPAALIDDWQAAIDAAERGLDASVPLRVFSLQERQQRIRALSLEREWLRNLQGQAPQREATPQRSRRATVVAHWPSREITYERVQAGRRGRTIAVRRRLAALWGSLVMERKMLLGIKERAEGVARGES